MTLDAVSTDAAPTRRSRRSTEPASQPVALTRAEWRRLQAERAARADAAEEQTAPERVVETLSEPAVEPGAQLPSHEDLPAEAPVAEPALSIAESVVAEAAATAAALRRRARENTEPGVSALDDAITTNAIPLSFVAAAEPCTVDEFERAARVLSFTGETPVQSAPAPQVALPVVPHVAARRGRRVGAKRMAAASFSVGVMAVVGLLAVGTTMPATVAAASNVTTDLGAVAPAPKETEDIQAYVSSVNGDETLDRSLDFDVASMADIAADSGVTQFAGTWVTDPTAAIQWPFPVGVPISAAYGSQSYLSKFSSPHRGVDFTPGTGAEIHVIADGTVRIATEAGGDYGVNVLVDHVIDGKIVSTRYAHMIYGSLRVKVGDKVKAGDVLGRVGATGKATGPHLHFEVLLDGETHVNPMEWMERHTKD